MIRPTDPDLPNVGQLEDDVAAYMRMRTDALKLGVVESLAMVVGKGMAFVISVVICSVALMALSLALVLFIGDLVGSHILGAVIVGVFFLIIAFIVWSMRVKFVDKMVGMFARMVFSTSKDD